MEQWSKGKKITWISVFAAILVIFGVAAVLLNNRPTQEGLKHFKVEVVSERDGYEKITDYKSDAEYLGEFLRTLEDCQWQESEYGIYIIGFDGMAEDTDNQYWWCVMADGEPSVTGADEIPLQDGVTYNFVLTQGW